MNRWLLTPEPAANGTGTLTTERPGPSYLLPVEVAQRLDKPMQWVEEQSWRLPVRRRPRTGEFWVSEASMYVWEAAARG